MLIILAFALTLSIAQSSFAAYTVGVKPGDWIKYQVTFSWTGTQPDTSDFGDLGQAQYIKGEVSAVDGTSVTVKMSMQMNNGTEITQTLTGDVATGQGDLAIFIAPSGMQKGDAFPGTMFGTGTMSLTITDTVSRTYAGASRTVNMYSLSMPPTSGFTATIAAYWDQATGILTELSMSMTTPQQSMDMKVLATETNMWTSGIFGFNLTSDPLLNTLILVGIIAAVAGGAAATVLVIMRRSHRTAATPMPTPAPEPVPTQ